MFAFQFIKYIVGKTYHLFTDNKFVVNGETFFFSQIRMNCFINRSPSLVNVSEDVAKNGSGLYLLFIAKININ